MLRGALIAAIYERSIKLTGKARIEGFGNGKLINHISTDVSRIDFAAGFFHLVSEKGFLSRPLFVLFWFGFETRRLTWTSLSSLHLCFCLVQIWVSVNFLSNILAVALSSPIFCELRFVERVRLIFLFLCPVSSLLAACSSHRLSHPALLEPRTLCCGWVSKISPF